MTTITSGNMQPIKPRDARHSLYCVGFLAETDKRPNLSFVTPFETRSNALES